MRIVVTVKESKKLREGFIAEEGAVADAHFDNEINESDRFSVEAAVRIAERSDEDVEVVAVTIGPSRSVRTIQQVLGMGVDRAVRVWDDALDDRPFLGSTTKARILDTVVDEEEPDLVLSGVQSDDEGFSATGVQLAELAGYQWAYAISEFEIGPAWEDVTVERELEGGLVEVSEIDLPAVLTLQIGINDPRYVSTRTMLQQTRGKEIVEKDLADLGLDSETVDAALDLVDVSSPESQTEYFEGDATETMAELATLLRETGVVR